MALTKKNIAIKQPYHITFASYGLNIHEQRIIMRIVQALQADVNHEILKAVAKKKASKSKKSGNPQENNAALQCNLKTTLFEDKVIQIPTKYLLPSGSQNYSCVREALKSLRQKTITIKSNKAAEPYETYTGFILQAKYYHHKELVEIQISKDLLPNFIMMSEGFTKYLFHVAFSLSTSNAIRIYQMICHWKREKRLCVYLEEYRAYLGLGNKYPNSSQFKQSVLIPAMHELKEKADVWFSIVKLIKGSGKASRKVIGWEIIIHDKRQEKPTPNDTAKPSLLPAPSATYATGITYEKLLHTLTQTYKLSKHQAVRIVEKVPVKEINKTLHAIHLVKMGPKGIATIGGYTYATFAKKYGNIYK